MLIEPDWIKNNKRGKGERGKKIRHAVRKDPTYETKG